MKFSTDRTTTSTQNPVHYKHADVNGLDIFYREAGPADAPLILLLHGFPTSSNMFRNLMPRLADTFHMVAPDYPGFGLSSMPDRKDFPYTFENLTNTVEQLVDKLARTKYSLYLMDYGAPIGCRLALRHPDRVQSLIIQNGNAYEEGLSQFWEPIKKYWADPSPENRKALHILVAPETTRFQYQDGVADRTLLDPTTWTLDQLGLDRPGNRDIQMDLFYDYRTNIALYPEFHAFFKEYQPPALIAWGKNDSAFTPKGAEAYARDLKNVDTHFLDTGHFALETHCNEITNLIESFFQEQQVEIPKKRFET
jgi:pimeloyl-ACP methyl ester carboxylesterase